MEGLMERQQVSEQIPVLLAAEQVAGSKITRSPVEPKSAFSVPTTKTPHLSGILPQEQVGKRSQERRKHRSLISISSKE